MLSCTSETFTCYPNEAKLVSMRCDESKASQLKLEILKWSIPKIKLITVNVLCYFPRAARLWITSLAPPSSPSSCVLFISHTVTDVLIIKTGLDSSWLSCDIAVSQPQGNNSTVSCMCVWVGSVCVCFGISVFVDDLSSPTRGTAVIYPPVFPVAPVTVQSSSQYIVFVVYCTKLLFDICPVHCYLTEVWVTQGKLCFPSDVLNLKLRAQLCRKIIVPFKAPTVLVIIFRAVPCSVLCTEHISLHHRK